ncbi:hypothetical protein Ancab_032818, partial [Ancistrocladus abbreviatus]
PHSKIPSLSPSLNMLNLLESFFSKFPATRRLHLRRDKATSKKPSSRSKFQSRTYQDNLDQLEKPLLLQQNNAMHSSCGYGHGYGHSTSFEKKRVIIKVLMTKEEAARLLTKHRDRKGRLRLIDVANELARIPSNRVSSTCHGMMLDRIPEEDSSSSNGTV